VTLKSAKFPVIKPLSWLPLANGQRSERERRDIKRDEEMGDMGIMWREGRDKIMTYMKTFRREKKV
jgi:hypothetical protein